MFTASNLPSMSGRLTLITAPRFRRIFFNGCHSSKSLQPQLRCQQYKRQAQWTADPHPSDIATHPTHDFLRPLTFTHFVMHAKFLVLAAVAAVAHAAATLRIGTPTTTPITGESFTVTYHDAGEPFNLVMERIPSDQQVTVAEQVDTSGSSVTFIVPCVSPLSVNLFSPRLQRS